MLAAATAARIIVRPGFAKPAPPPQLIDPDEALNVSSDDRKPEFVLPGISGASRSLADYRGHPVLVHFFATWCEPCRPEMQALERLIARHGNNVVMRIVAISVAEPGGRVQRHFEKFPVSFSILLDRDRAVAKSWNVQTLPTSFLLGTDLTPHFLSSRNWNGIGSIFRNCSSLSKRERPPARPCLACGEPGQIKRGDKMNIGRRDLLKADAALSGAWEADWLAYNFARDVVLPGVAGPTLEFLMYPQAEAASVRIDCLDPDNFRYTITAQEISV